MELFSHRRECQSVDELEELRLSSENMHIEALLVRERLLGATSEEYRYSVIYRGAILADNGQYDAAVALWMYELELSRKYSIPIDPEYMRQFVAFFSGMISDPLSIPIEALLTIITTVAEEVKTNLETIDANLYTLLYLTTIISQVVILQK